MWARKPSLLMSLSAFLFLLLETLSQKLFVFSFFILSFSHSTSFQRCTITFSLNNLGCNQSLNLWSFSFTTFFSTFGLPDHVLSDIIFTGLIKKLANFTCSFWPKFFRDWILSQIRNFIVTLLDNSKS